MLIQPMNATKQLKRINQKLNYFSSGASIGILQITVCAKINLVIRVPMYSEAKLVFFIYLWYPKTKGTTYVYDSFFRPYVAKHETEIDRNLLELRTRAGDMAVLYWQRAASYGQTRMYDIFQYVAAQSTPSPSPAKQRQAVKVRQPPPATAIEAQVEGPPSPASSTSSSQQQKEVAEELGSTQMPKAASPVRGSSILRSNSVPETTSKSAPTEAKPLQPDATPALSSSSENENGNPPPKDTVMEDSIRVTHGRLRKTRSAGNR
ncbi:putative HVA22-like protein g [Senna tora]|uniref:HVA22-like protein n=1 Tax=Senna tora TaxID=362788 RepID=A0A834WN53_9FABA|nr:putative HVA22-like protein g [Senna tora]